MYGAVHGRLGVEAAVGRVPAERVLDTVQRVEEAAGTSSGGGKPLRVRVRHTARFDRDTASSASCRTLAGVARSALKLGERGFHPGRR